MKYLFAVMIVLLLLLSVTHAESIKIQYPADYQSSFTNYVSNDRIMHPDQTIRLFANEIAMSGPDADGKLPYGSILVAEVYKAKKNDDGTVMKSALNRRIKGKLALVAVMQREEGWGDGQPKELWNDDWAFSTFKPDGSIAEKDLNECRACHAPLTQKNHVFSYEHLVR